MFLHAGGWDVFRHGGAWEVVRQAAGSGVVTGWQQLTGGNGEWRRGGRWQHPCRVLVTSHRVL